MSLRNQIIFRILLSAIVILVLAGSLTLWQARRSVEKEISSSIQLAVDIMNLGINHLNLSSQDLSHFRALQPSRHLSIQLQQANGHLLSIQEPALNTQPESPPPDWFVKAMSVDFPSIEHQINTRDGQQLKLIITPRPLDEITEAWQESIMFFSSMSLLMVLSFFAIHWVLSKSLAAISVMVGTLRSIETGNYHHRLPSFSALELDTIANAINHLSSELQQAQSANQALTRHTLSIQEAERQQLSQDLHDEFGQSLTAIKVMAAAAVSPKADLTQISRSIQDSCEHLIQVLRSMMQQLHPLILSQLGLVATLEDLVSVWQKRYPNLDWQLDYDPDIDHLPDALSIQLFRVIQECLTNCVRHAQAQQIKIELHTLETTQELQLAISDDGQGCSDQQLYSGFGLKGIRERIHSLKGRLDIITAPQQGMQITAIIPL
ncbi:MAG: histidine kinase [Methylococcaceae bacterium]|nr:histidine kinase [Methylococcaceae bacterium]